MTPTSQTDPGIPKKTSVARVVTVIVRILLGLMLLVFGLNGFLNFLPRPSTPLPEGAMAFAGALMQSGYMFPLIFGTQLVVGILLLLNRYVPLALVLFAPFMVNSMAFHIFLEHSGLPMAAIFLAFEVGLIWAYRKAYGPLFTARFAAK